MRTLLLSLLAVACLGCETVDPSEYEEEDQALWSEEDPMGAPLFVKDPIVGAGMLTSLSGGLPSSLLELYEATAPTLIERVLWATHATGQIDAGEILLALVPPGGGVSYTVKYEHIDAYDPAPLGTSYLCGEIRLDLVLTVGWKLVAMTTVEKTGGGDATFAMTALGGELQ